MADPTNFTIEEKATGFLFSGDLGMGRKEYLAKFSDYMPIRMGIGTADEYVYMKPLNGAIELGRLYPDNISSPPFGSAEDLFTWLTGFFVSASSTTYAVLLADLQNGPGPVGQWVFVSDVLDSGAWLFCASSTEVAKDGFGLFLNADFQNAGTYLASYSGHPCSQTNYGQWRPTVGNFLINIGAITGGPFTAGESITTATWSGIYVSDNGSGVLTAYSVDSTSYPLAGETITGATSGAFCVQSGASGINQLTGGGVVVYQDSTSGQYQHYLCIDPSAINGAKTPDASAAYMLLDRTVASAGYIPAVDAIEFDFLGNDTRTTKGWLVGRKNASHSIRLTEATAAEKFSLTYSDLHTYPWGSDTIKGLRIDDGRMVLDNAGDLSIENVYIAQDSIHTPTMGAGSAISNFAQEPNTIVQYTLDPSVEFSNVTVRARARLTGKTFTASVRDFTVGITDTMTESRALAPFGTPNMKRQVFKITAAQLADNGTFGTLPGIPLFTMPEGTYPIGNVTIQSFYGTAPFTLVSDFVIRVNFGTPQYVVAQIAANVIHGANSNRSACVALSSNSGNTATNAIPYGSTFYLSSAGSTNLASVGDGYIVVIFEYYERCEFTM